MLCPESPTRNLRPRRASRRLTARPDLRGVARRRPPGVARGWRRHPLRPERTRFRLGHALPDRHEHGCGDTHRRTLGSTGRLSHDRRSRVPRRHPLRHRSLCRCEQLQLRNDRSEHGRVHGDRHPGRLELARARRQHLRRGVVHGGGRAIPLHAQVDHARRRDHQHRPHRLRRGRRARLRRRPPHSLCHRVALPLHDQYVDRRSDAGRGHGLHSRPRRPGLRRSARCALSERRRHQQPLPGRSGTGAATPVGANGVNATINSLPEPSVVPVLCLGGLLLGACRQIRSK